MFKLLKAKKRFWMEAKNRFRYWYKKLLNGIILKNLKNMLKRAVIMLETWFKIMNLFTLL